MSGLLYCLYSENRISFPCYPQSLSKSKILPTSPKDPDENEKHKVVLPSNKKWKMGAGLLQLKKTTKIYYTYNYKYKSAITVGTHMKIYRSN